MQLKVPQPTTRGYILIDRLLKCLAISLIIFTFAHMGAIRFFKPQVLEFAPPAMIHSVEGMVSNPIGDIVLCLVEWDLFIDKISKYDSVVVIWNGPGGWVAVEEEVVAKLKEAEKHTQITFVVTDIAASADAMAICEFDNVKISPNAALLYHLMEGAGGLIKDGSVFSTCVSKGYLTAKDVEAMLAGKEIWVRYDKDGNRLVEYRPDRRIKANSAASQAALSPSNGTTATPAARGRP